MLFHKEGEARFCQDDPKACRLCLGLPSEEIPGELRIPNSVSRIDDYGCVGLRERNCPTAVQRVDGRRTVKFTNEG
jgi:hypothetical protein